MKKEIMVIKDTKFLGLQNILEVQWSKRSIDENDKILDKENVRSTIDLEGAQVEGSDASDRLKKFVPELVLAQAKEIGDLQAQINAISKECAVKVDMATKESSEKMIALTRLDAHKEDLNHASEVCEIQNQEIEKLKAINDEIYKENQDLKADKKRLINEAVKLDENIKNLNSLVTDKLTDDGKEYLAKEVETLNVKIMKMTESVLKFNTENNKFKVKNESLVAQVKDLQDSLVNTQKTVRDLSEQKTELDKNILQLNEKLVGQKGK